LLKSHRTQENHRYSSARAILTGKTQKRLLSRFYTTKQKAACRRFRQKSRGRSTRKKQNSSAYPLKDFIVRAAVSVPSMAVSSTIVASPFSACLSRGACHVVCFALPSKKTGE